MVITHETLVLGGTDSKGNPLSLAQAESLLDEIAAWMGKAKRAFFVERWIRETPRSLTELKNAWSKQFGLTNRQFTSVRMEIDGKAQGRLESMKLESETLAGKIKSALDRVAKWEKKSADLLKLERQWAAWRKTNKERQAAFDAKAAALAAAPAKTQSKKPPAAFKPRAKPKALTNFSLWASRAERSTLRKLIQGKKRKVAKMKAREASLDQDIKNKRPRMCFGGSKLFRAQHHLAENGFKGHAEWRAAWRAERDSQIFCAGSHDESHGNQIATLIDSETLRLRVPPGLEKQRGAYLFLKLKTFRKGQEEVEAACRARKSSLARADKARLGAGENDLAVSWRLVRKNARRGAIWVAQASFEKKPASKAPLWGHANGALGVDFNADHLALCWIDRHGNPMRAKSKRGREILEKTKNIPLDARGKTREQVGALVGDAAALIVSIALELSIPIVAEKLDFAAKKRELGERPKQYSRMLSSLAYSKFHETLNRRAERDGATVLWVNPAFTSVIGQAKFALGYQMTSHQAAACAIARRGLRFKHAERKITRARRASPRSASSENGFPGPARTRGKHEWSDWRRVGAWRRAQRKARHQARLAGRLSDGAAGPGASPAIQKAGMGAAHGPPGDRPDAPTFCDPPLSGESRAQAGKSCSPGVSVEPLCVN